MEVRIDKDAHIIDARVREWLASMGYPVAGMPAELLHRMLVREARQWQLSPEALRALIDECSEAGCDQRTQGDGATRPVEHRLSPWHARMSI